MVLILTSLQGQRLSARAALISGQDIVVALREPKFCLLALSLSQLEEKWSRSPDYSQWEVVTYVLDDSVSPVTTNRIVDQKSMLQLDNFGGIEEPWVLALHSYTPAWHSEDVSPEIILVAYDRLDAKRLLTYKVQLLRATDAGTTDQGQRMRLLAQGCAPARTVPWNPNCITNAGRMIALREKSLLGFSPFTDAEQPSKSIDMGIDVQPDKVATTSAVEPYSGAVVIGTPGLVRILYFN